MLNKMISLLLVCSALCVAAGDDTPETRRAAAEAYMSDIGMKALVGDILENLKKSLPPDKADEVIAFVKTETNWDLIEKASLDALAKVFTTKEIKAMHTFNKTEEGQAIMKKMGPYMGEVFPAMQQEMNRVVMKALAQEKAAKEAEPAHEDHDHDH